MNPSDSDSEDGFQSSVQQFPDTWHIDLYKMSQSVLVEVVPVNNTSSHPHYSINRKFEKSFRNFCGHVFASFNNQILKYVLPLLSFVPLVEVEFLSVKI